ncbi:MAG: rhodanese-like domain-containing protein [Deltaproteobacteria bacterium]
MTTSRLPVPLVSVSWLAAHVQDPDLVLLDATFHPVAVSVPAESAAVRLPVGYEQVSVLDGGLPAWVEAGLPCESGPPALAAPGDFVAKPRPALFCGAEQVSAALGDPRALVLDARSEGRFSGREPEPRPGLRAGHMPNALNLPLSTVQHRGRMRTAEELAAVFATKVRGQELLVFSCGSGVTACVLALAATLAGYSELRVYDGSWSEWGLPSSRPVVTG